MLILAILVLGLASGGVANLMVGRAKRSWGQLFLIGITGSFVGGLLGSLINGDGIKLRLSGILGSVIGSVIVVLLVRAFGSKSTAQR